MPEANHTDPSTFRQKKHNEDHISRADLDNEDDINAEEKNIVGDSNPLPDLQRRLKSRHLAMIAIGEILEQPLEARRSSQV